MEETILDGLGLDPEVAGTILERHRQVVAGFEQQLLQQSRDAALKQAITAAGGRNHRAIRALLDENALSGDLDEAAREAVATVRRENPYLFAGAPLSSPGTGTAIAPPPGIRDLEKMSLAEYRQYRKGGI